MTPLQLAASRVIVHRRPPRPGYDPAMKAAVVRLREAKLTYEQIADALGISRDQAVKMYRRHLAVLAGWRGR